MLRSWWWGALLAAVLALAGTAAAAPPKGGTVTVQAITAKLMKKPRLIGATAGTVGRGTHLTFIGAQRDWYRVRTAAGIVAWINKAAVIDRRVKLNARPGGGTGGASADEVALAGRGFSPEVEGQYREKHPELDFSHVDAIEKLDVDPAAVAQFAADGNVGGGP